MQDLKPLPPRFVNDGPIFENVLEGDDVDVLKFPVPRHHELDKARFIGTADCVMTQDPDTGWFNLGAYRSQVYDGRTVGCQITEGKHGRIHRDKYFERGEPMKVVILCGQDPLLFMLSSSPLPEVGEMDIAGGLRGEPIDVVRGPYTGFPIPADCEIAIEGETVPGQVKPEGPFGEWMGYYSDDTQERPYVNVKTILHRNDPILTCAPQHKPVDETGLLKGIAGAAQIWRALDACGVPEVLGVWNHEAGPATRFTAIQIKQRYPGHARQALHIAASCQGGAYAGKWTVVVDDDIDAGDLDQVLWAMCTRFDPLTDIDTIQKAWASKRDPLFLPGNFNNRILVDACIPYDKKLKGTFPVTVDVSADLRKKLRGEIPAAVSDVVGRVSARNRIRAIRAASDGFRSLIRHPYEENVMHLIALDARAAARSPAVLSAQPRAPPGSRTSTRARPSRWSSATAWAAATMPMRACWRGISASTSRAIPACCRRT